MTLRHLRVFDAVHREGSITRAAEKLYTSQPAVSRTVRELEDHYGCKLFERIGRKLFITPQGREIYEYAQRILALFDELDAFAENQGRSVVKVGTGIAVGKLIMPKLVKVFKAVRPDIVIRVTVNNSMTIEQLLVQGELDLGVMEGTVNSGRLARRILQVSPIVAICAADNPLARRKMLSVRDLVDQRILLREEFSDTREAMERVFARHNLRIRPEWESVSALALINAVSEGLGVSFLPLNYVQAFQNANVAILDVRDIDQKRSIFIAHRQHRQLPEVMRVFIEFCTEHIKVDF